MTTQAISTMEGKPLPDKYAKLTRAPGIPDTGRLRLFLQGKVASGKTFFACSWPRTAILDFENKTSAVRRRGPGTHIFQFKTAKEYDDLIEMLVADGVAGHPAFDTVAFDTVEAFRNLRRRAITEEYRNLKKLKGPGDITDYKSEGAGWSILNADINNTFERIYQAGYGWMALAHVVPVFLPASRVRDGQPLHEGRQVAIVFWPQQQMPMIGHHRVGANPHRRRLGRFTQHAFERLEIRRLFKQLHAPDATIQNMKHHPTRCDSR